MALPVLTPSSQTSKVVLPATGTLSDVIATAVPYGVYLDNTDFAQRILGTTCENIFDPNKVIETSKKFHIDKIINKCHWQTL